MSSTDEFEIPAFRAHPDHLEWLRSTQRDKVFAELDRSVAVLFESYRAGHLNTKLSMVPWLEDAVDIAEAELARIDQRIEELRSAR